MAVAELERRNPYKPAHLLDVLPRNVTWELVGLLLFGGMVYCAKERLTGDFQTAGFVVLGVVFLVLLFRNLTYGIWAMIFAIGLSPDSAVSGLPNVRFEDFMLPVLLVVWWVRHNQKGDSLVRTEVFDAIRLYMAVITISTVRGYMMNLVWGGLTVPYYGKYVEYFLIFWLVLNNVKNREDLALVLTASIIVCAIVGWIALEQRAVVEARGTSHPFVRAAGPKGETPNVLGGYYLLHMMLAFSMLFILRNNLYRMLLLAFLVAVAVPMLYTYSRTSFISLLLGLVITMVFVDIRYSLLLLVLGLLVPVIFPVAVGVLPDDLVGRYQTIFNIFDPEEKKSVSSWTARYSGWYDYYTSDFVNYPVLGKGVGSMWLGVDNDYVKKFFESGLLGLLAFLWILFRLFRTALETARTKGDDLCRAFAVGYIGGLAGMMVHAMGVCSFTTIRTATPFWLFSGVLVAAHHIVSRDKDLADEEAEDRASFRLKPERRAFAAPAPRG